jgi:hypothetical protein
VSVAGWLDALHSDCPPAHRLVWMCLESHANKARRWRITDREIADELHLSDDTVGRAIAALEAGGIISAERRKRQPTIYAMLRIYPSAKRPKPNGHDVASRPELTPQIAESSDQLTPQKEDSTMLPEVELTPQIAESSGELSPQIADPKTPTRVQQKERAPPTPQAGRAVARAGWTGEHQIVWDAWNAMARTTGLAPARTQSPQRQRDLTKRLATYGLAEVLEAIDRVGRSSVLPRQRAPRLAGRLPLAAADRQRRAHQRRTLRQPHATGPMGEIPPPVRPTRSQRR